VNSKYGKKSACWRDITNRCVAELLEKSITLSGKPLRPFGLCAGEFTFPDNFDTPLP
jgi:hypothetical protein